EDSHVTPRRGPPGEGATAGDLGVVRVGVDGEGPRRRVLHELGHGQREYASVAGVTETAAVNFGTFKGDGPGRVGSRSAGTRRTPTVAEKRRALSLPWRIVVLTICLWAGAALVFGPLQLIYGKSVLDTFGVVDSIVLGGLCTGMLTFLLVERALRPVLSLALMG